MKLACKNCGGSGVEDVSGFGHLEACAECIIPDESPKSPVQWQPAQQTQQEEFTS